MKKSLNGFIVVHRRLLDWEWYDDVNTKAVFIHLLLMASFSDTAWHGVQIKRGDVVTSVNSLTEQLGLTPRKVRTALEHLQKTGEVTIKAHSKFSVITVTNYDLYQSTDKQPTSSGQTDDEQAAKSRPSTDDQAAFSRQHRNNNNNYNNNNNKTKKRAGARRANFDVDELEELSVFSQY